MKKQSKSKNLELELKNAQEREKRAVADYKNLVRRQQEERLEIIKLASGELVTDLIQPLDHLDLAAKQVNNQGLDMVLSQLWEVLQNHGLEEINPKVGDKFDLELMEVVVPRQAREPLKTKNSESKISKITSKGYKLNGKVIRHAKVIVN